MLMTGYRQGDNRILDAIALVGPDMGEAHVIVTYVRVSTTALNYPPAIERIRESQR